MYNHSLNEVICSFQGDLGAIDDKYDVAISTACGALDNIVCDSIDTAQRCITFLKHNNIGAATFIGLDKVNIQGFIVNHFSLNQDSKEKKIRFARP